MIFLCIGFFDIMITTSDIYRLIAVHVSDGGNADVLYISKLTQL
jgi:hypothetical protein